MIVHAQDRRFKRTPGIIDSRALGAWYDYDWGFRKMITLLAAKVPNTDQLNFPVLVNRTDPDWRDTINGGHVGQPDGRDILFTSELGTKLDHEIENYTDTNGNLVAWVRIPSLSATNNTIIYIYYGHATCGAQENPAGVWDANYVCVYHSKDLTNITIKDSTANGYTGNKKGVGEPVEANGQIYKAQDYDGANDYVNLTDLDDLDGLAKLTIEAWVSTDVLAGGLNNLRYVASKEPVGAATGWMIRLATATDKIQFYIGDGAWRGPAETGVIAALTLYHVVAVYDSTLAAANQLKIYLDGGPVGAGVGAGNVITANAIVVWLGDCASFPTRAWDGIIDEIRFSDTARSADWILTSFNNQDAPAAFYNVGAEEEG